MDRCKLVYDARVILNCLKKVNRNFGRLLYHIFSWVCAKASVVVRFQINNTEYFICFRYVKEFLSRITTASYNWLTGKAKTYIARPKCDTKLFSRAGNTSSRFLNWSRESWKKYCGLEINVIAQWLGDPDRTAELSSRGRCLVRHGWFSSCTLWNEQPSLSFAIINVTHGLLIRVERKNQNCVTIF